MSWFFDQWVYGTAVPEYSFSYTSRLDNDGKVLAGCQVIQENVGPDFKMLIPITVLFEDDRYVHLKLWVDKKVNDIELPRLPMIPKDIIFNTYDAVLCDVKDDR